MYNQKNMRILVNIEELGRFLSSIPNRDWQDAGKSTLREINANNESPV